MEKEIRHKRLINKEDLEIGASYLIQYGADMPSFIGKLISIDKRYSQKYVEVKSKNSKGKDIISRKLVLSKPQYDILILEGEPQLGVEKSGIVSRIFENTLNPSKQLYFTNALIFTDNIIKETINDWVVSKMLDVSGMKISNANLYVTIKIAESMMSKLNYSSYSKKIILEMVLKKAIEIVDLKQYEWEKLMESQANQLPF